MNKITVAVLSGASLLLSSCYVPYGTYGVYGSYGTTVDSSVSWSAASYDANGYPIYGYSYGQPVYGYTEAGVAITTIAAITALCCIPDWGPASWYRGPAYHPHGHRYHQPPHHPHGHKPGQRPPSNHGPSGHNGNQHVNHNVNRNTNHNVNRNVNHNANRSASHSMGRSTSHQRTASHSAMSRGGGFHGGGHHGRR